MYDDNKVWFRVRRLHIRTQLHHKIWPVGAARWAWCVSMPGQYSTVLQAGAA
jgi:hypothetical protein